MTKTEAVIRSILGAARPDIRPMAYAVDAAISLMFVQKIPMDDIYVTDLLTMAFPYAFSYPPPTEIFLALPY